MLATQVQYWQYKENQRHNIMYEKLTDFQNREQQRHNLETEHQGRLSISEAVRHNKVTEKEIKRHNVATERFSYDSLAETKRHNLASENLTQQNINLGYANLSETSRHNRVSETIQHAQQRLASHKASYEMQNLVAQTRYTSANTAKTGQDTIKSKAETELTQTKTKFYPLEAGAEIFSDISKGVFNLSKSAETLKGLFGGSDGKKASNTKTGIDKNFWDKVARNISKSNN